MPHYDGGGEMIRHVIFSGTTFAELPFKFEAGTPDFVDITPFVHGLDYFRWLGIDNIPASEHELLEWTTSEMMKIPGMHIFGTAPGKAAVISFLIGHPRHYDTGMVLDELGVAVRTGRH